MHNPSRAEPPAGDVHVRYRLTAGVGEPALEAAVAVLSGEERARYERFHVDRDRHEYAMAHALLRTTLSEFGDLSPAAWRFQTGPQGKPMIDAAVSTSRLTFSLSHARDIVACAVARDAAVGIDVELATRRLNWRGVAGRFFSAAEVAQIDGAAEHERMARFFELWTLKEALAKALGVGVVHAPPAVDAATWHFAVYTPAPEHRMAVAVSDGSPRRWHIHVERAAS